MKPAAKKRPNLLLITCDQWRGDCLSAVGHATVKTPNSDALASEGVLFRNHFGGAAPCSPARACLYTGLYQMNNRVCRNGTPLDARHDNIALMARRLGYEPTLFGYTDVSPDPRMFDASDPVLRTYEGVLPGFTARQMLPEHQKQWLSWLKSRGIETDKGFPEIHTPAGGATDDVTNAPPLYGRDETPAAFLTGEFLRWLGEQETPWFAHISYLSPHPPFIVPEPFNTMFAPEDGPDFRRSASWKQEAELHPYVAHELAQQKRGKFLPGMKGKVHDFSEAEFGAIRAIYYGMIAEVDHQLGRLWQGLKNAAVWDDTIVVLTSDHAEMMGDHFMLGKGGFYDQSYHIPLIIRDPRAPNSQGRQVRAFTEAVDVLPTVGALLDAPRLAHLDGRSLTPWLDGEDPAAWRNAAHWEFDFRDIQQEDQLFGLKPQQCNLAVVRTATHKYVHFGGGLPPLLFDLVDDPNELVNRADDPRYAGIRIELAEQLLSWRAEHLDQSLALAELTEQGPVGNFAKRHA